MHELSLAQNIIDIVRDEMGKHHATTLNTLRLAVGRMSGIVPDSLSFCLELITQGTDLQGATIIIDVIPLCCRCETCHKEFETPQFTARCPLCGSPEIAMISGRELSIVELEVDQAGGEA